MIKNIITVVALFVAQLQFALLLLWHIDLQPVGSWPWWKVWYPVLYPATLFVLVLAIIWAAYLLAQILKLVWRRITSRANAQEKPSE